MSLQRAVGKREQVDELELLSTINSGQTASLGVRKTYIKKAKMVAS